MGKGLTVMLIGLFVALWIRSRYAPLTSAKATWIPTTASDKAIFSGVTPQRGIFGTDGTPVAGAV